MEGSTDALLVTNGSRPTNLDVQHMFRAGNCARVDHIRRLLGAVGARGGVTRARVTGCEDDGSTSGSHFREVGINDIVLVSRACGGEEKEQQRVNRHPVTQKKHSTNEKHRNFSQKSSGAVSDTIRTLHLREVALPSIRDGVNVGAMVVRKDRARPVFEVKAEVGSVPQPELRLNVWRNAHDVLDVEAGLDAGLLLVLVANKLGNFFVTGLGRGHELLEKGCKVAVLLILALEFGNSHAVGVGALRGDATNVVGLGQDCRRHVSGICGQLQEEVGYNQLQPVQHKRGQCRPVKSQETRTDTRAGRCGSGKPWRPKMAAAASSTSSGIS